MTASRSFGESASSSAAVQIRSTSTPKPYSEPVTAPHALAQHLGDRVVRDGELTAAVLAEDEITIREVHPSWHDTEYVEDWIEYFCRPPEPVATCDPVAMEVLAGARDERHLTQLRGLLALGVTLPTGPADYDLAASLYRTCRARGETMRKLIDCLIGAVAMQLGAQVLHADADFSVLARHTDLRVHPQSLDATG